MLTQNFTRCIAKITGDGYINTKYIRYNNTCPQLLQEFESDIIQEFGHVTITKGITNTHTPFVQLHAKSAIQQFFTYLPDYRSDFVKVPKDILKNPKLYCHYLRSIYDDEGSAIIRLFNKTQEWKRNLTITSNSYQLLEHIKTMLNFFEIKSAPIKPNNKNSQRDRSFYVGITGRINFQKYQKHIGFTHPKKQLLLDLMIQSYGNTYSRNKSGFNIIKEKLDLIRNSF